MSFSQVERAADRGQVARVLIRDNEVTCGLPLLRCPAPILTVSGEQMYVKRFEHGWHSRIRSALALINDAILTSVEPIPNIEFALHTGDWVRVESFASRRTKF